MFLEKLTITSDAGVIRDIPFKLRGVNLIIDRTEETEDRSVSGNNVGKTTFLRSVDFCLGSLGLDIYQDKELKSDNEEIKNYLVDKNVTFHLSLLKVSGEKVILRRSFNKELDLVINGEQKKGLKDYKESLNEIFFGLKGEESPITFRQLIKKFVRSDDDSANNIFKILHSTTKPNVYWGMYLILFGFKDHHLIKTQTETKNRIDDLNRRLKVVKGIHSLDELKQKFEILQIQIAEKENHIKTFPLPEAYDKLITELTRLKGVTSGLSSEVSSLSTKIAFNKKSKAELAQSRIHIDPVAVRQLYEEAKRLVPDVQKEFEDVLLFHERMIVNKIKFIDQHIEKLQKEFDSKNQVLQKRLEEQSGILKMLQDTGTFDDLVKVRNEVDGLLVEKGKVMSQIEQIENLQADIKTSAEHLKELEEKFENYKEEIKANTDIFNKYMMQYSERAHGEKIYIYYDTEKNMFDMSNLQGNAGKGYKKSDIIIFDLSYLSFANEVGIQCPRFIMHDELEIIHHNQVQTIFDIADSINGQLFVSVLKDKIDFLGEPYIKEHEVLSLAQNDKFFKV